MQKFEYEYPRPAVATDCVVFGFDGQELKVLLIQRGIEPFKGMWAFPGGFMRMDETAEECAVRELAEETGLVLRHVRQLGAFSGVGRDPRERVVSIAFYALARQSEVRGGDDAASAHWWTVRDIPQLAFDHDHILRKAMDRIRQDIHFEPIGFGLLDDEFTIADLQRLYECVLGVHFDRRNFCRKILQTGILREASTPATHPTNAPQAPAPSAPQYFGRRHEMKRLSIDALFGGCADANADAHAGKTVCRGPSADYDNAANPASGVSPLAADEPPQRNVGRKGKLFRFDKDNYDRLKENGVFRLEF